MNLNPNVAPGSNFDLSHWKLTLPDAREIPAADLVAGFELPDTFFTAPHSGGMVFASRNRAGHTSGSHYSRCELREMLKPDGSASDPANNWTCAQGGHLMARLRVDRVSETGDDDKVGRVVIGQIHGPETEVVRLYYAKQPGEADSRIYVGMDDVDNQPKFFDIVRGVPLGERFAYSIELRGLKLVVLVHTRSGPHVLTRRIDPRYRELPLYFKAGVYNQNDTGEDTDFAQATFFKLVHSHP